MVKSVNSADLDELQFRLQCGIGLVSAVQTAIVEGNLGTRNWGDALFGACNYLGGISRELRDMIDGKECDGHALSHQF